MHLLQVGAGSGGMAVLDLVTRDPRVTRVTLVEPDTYAAHNVYRHFFPPSAVGQRKVDLATQWVRAIRPDIVWQAMAADITAPEHQADLAAYAAACDVGVCAADNELAKFAFDALMRQAGKPWTLGEVLSGGIGGWVHRFVPGGPCYGCVASALQRHVTETPPPPPPDYHTPGGPAPETTVPASKASIAVIAGLHALVTLDLLASRACQPPAAGHDAGDTAGPNQEQTRPVPRDDFTSLLFSLRKVPGVFDVAFRPHRMRIARSPTCLICGITQQLQTGEQLDAAVDEALARLGG